MVLVVVMVGIGWPVHRGHVVGGFFHVFVHVSLMYSWARQSMCDVVVSISPGRSVADFASSSALSFPCMFK